MFSEVELKSVTHPMAFYFRDIKGDFPKKIFESCANTNAVSVQAVESSCLGKLIDTYDKGLSC